MTDQIGSSLPKAFVIGPIGEKDAEHDSDARVAYEEAIQVFAEVIEPACAAFGFEAIRADMISRTGEIPEQIFRQLRDCPVVIADLTSANPNVMYELGLRHTTGKVTIQLGEKGRLPFDVAAIRTIMFKRTEAGLVQARKDLSKALAANVDVGGDPVTATRIWFEPTSIEGRAGKRDALENSEPVLAGEDSPGFLELLAEMETGTASLAQTMAAATAILHAISKIYVEATEEIGRSDARGGGAASRLAIADTTASKLDDQASRMEVVSGEFKSTVERVEPGIQYVLERLATEPEQLAQLPDFPKQVGTMAEAAASSIEGAARMRANVIEMGKASRALKRVGQRLESSLKRFADSSSRIASWITLVQRVPGYERENP